MMLFWTVPTVLAQADALSFPRPLDSYGTSGQSVWEALSHRAAQEPFNVVATVIFLLAILHTFFAPAFIRLAHRCEREHREKIEREGRTAEAKALINAKDDVSFRAEVLHFFGEVEVIFGIWVIPLLIAWGVSKGWSSAQHYADVGVNFSEPVFVVVVMTISASRPLLRLAESIQAWVAKLGHGSPAAWWFSILTVGPLLGSFITEPAAMTISALLMARKFYDHKPSSVFAYATLGLLFVNISVGGTLTHFAAPPVLMISAKWGWDTPFMLTHFGWKALLGIVIANGIYLLWFRREFNALVPVKQSEDKVALWEDRIDPVPAWVTVVTLGFLLWAIANSHHPVLFVGGFLFYLGFTEATEHHQNEVNLRSPLLVGFFLAGLVIHGGLQGWWLEPVLSSLTASGLFMGSIFLTAFNDNAAITYLASLVPTFSPELKYAVLSGAVTGGGLTVIANAPNPAGQSILSKYFPDGVSPLKLMLGAFLPTVIVAICFLVLR